MVEQAMESKIAFVELLGTQKKGTFDNLPLETEYLIIGCLILGTQEKGSLKNLPLGLKKIIVIDFDEHISYWSGHKELTEYFNYITDGKIPFGCKIETIRNENFYLESNYIFEAFCDFKDKGKRFFELNSLVQKGTYDYVFYNYEGQEIDRDFLMSVGKKVYFNIDF